MIFLRHKHQMNIVKRNTYNNNKLQQLLGVNRIGMLIEIT